MRAGATSHRQLKMILRSIRLALRTLCGRRGQQQRAIESMAQAKGGLYVPANRRQPPAHSELCRPQSRFYGPTKVTLTTPFVNPNAGAIS
jgi:hypothetical protein